MRGWAENWDSVPGFPKRSLLSDCHRIDANKMMLGLSAAPLRALGECVEYIAGAPTSAGMKVNATMRRPAGE